MYIVINKYLFLFCFGHSECSGSILRIFWGWKLKILIITLRLAWKILILIKKFKEKACIHLDWLIRGQNLKNAMSKSAIKLNQVLDKRDEWNFIKICYLNQVLVVLRFINPNTSKPQQILLFNFPSRLICWG